MSAPDVLSHRGFGQLCGEWFIEHRDVSDAMDQPGADQVVASWGVVSSQPTPARIAMAAELAQQLSDLVSGHPVPRLPHEFGLGDDA